MVGSLQYGASMVWFPRFTYPSSGSPVVAAPTVGPLACSTISFGLALGAIQVPRTLVELQDVGMYTSRFRYRWQANVAPMNL